MTTVLNTIGLDQQKSKVLAGKLNELLANYQIFYINVRGFHWNIKGENFFELHDQFEQLYTNLQEKIDEIAERIVTLGHTPDHSFEDYLGKATVKPKKEISNGRDAVEAVLGAMKEILVYEREILNLSDEANDEGTNAQMSDYIQEQEKTAWMYSSFLGGKK